MHFKIWIFGEVVLEEHIKSHALVGRTRNKSRFKSCAVRNSLIKGISSYDLVPSLIVVLIIVIVNNVFSCLHDGETDP